MAVVLFGLVASVAIISNLSNLEHYEMVQIGVGPEDENDATVASALGEPLSNATNGITDEMKAAADDAISKTSTAAAAEIDAALTKGENDGKGTEQRTVRSLLELSTNIDWFDIVGSCMGSKH